MLTMQYSFTLPRDYDMSIIRERVAQKGAGADGLPHLGFKAFLMAEAGKNGSQENLYAPFYLWNSEQGMLGFLCGDSFVGLTQSFGWPTVRTWSPIAFDRGSATEARYATRRIIQIPPYSDLAAFRQAEQDAHEAALLLPHIHSRIAALDPFNWDIVQFTLWSSVEAVAEAVPADAQRYEVLHLSAPGINGING